MNNALKNGYYARPVRMEDLEPMVEMFNAYEHTQIGADGDSVEQIRVQWESPILDIAKNTMAVFSENHRPVGYVEFWDNGEPHVRYFNWGAIHPAHWNQGLGTFLTEWVIQRAKKQVALAPEGTRVVLQGMSADHNRAAFDLLACHGFNHVRNSHTMTIQFDGPPPAPELPEGIVVRPIQNEEEQREAYRTVRDSFKDHWGFVDEPFEEAYKRYKHFIDNDPRHDASLWFLALDGDQIAGISLCYPFLDDDPEQGWVSTLGVRRPWRKHGLGLALLRHSFGEFYRRGKPRVGLGVDASNLTGALRLYERAGMHVKRTSHTYELELRPGRDLMTQSI